MQQLDSHRSHNRSSVQKEEEPTASRMLDSVLNEVYDCITSEFLKRSETEVS